MFGWGAKTRCPTTETNKTDGTYDTVSRSRKGSGSERLEVLIHFKEIIPEHTVEHGDEYPTEYLYYNVNKCTHKLKDRQWIPFLDTDKNERYKSWIVLHTGVWLFMDKLFIS